jgi:signal transduction histidine kinase
MADFDLTLDSQTADTSSAPVEAFFANVPLGMLILDEQLRVRRANDALAEMIGSGQSEWTGMPLESLMPEVAAELAPEVRRVLSTGESVRDFSFSATLPGDSSSTRQWLSAIFPIAADQSTRDLARRAIVGVVLREITSRTDALEREARRVPHREGLHGLTAALVEATTPAEVVRAAVRHATAAFAAAGTVVARCTADQAYVEILDAEGMPPDVAAEWRRFPTSAPVPLAYVTRTGQPLFLESAEDWEQHFPELAKLATDVGHTANAVVPLLVERRSVGAIGIAFTHPRRFDDDDRALAETMGRQCALALERARLLESERAARAAAVKASQQVTKFIATLSHELRSPLQGISSYTDLLELEVDGPLTAEQRRTLAHMQHALQHVLNLVGEVLSLLRAEAGHVEYALEDVPLDGMLRFVEDVTRPQCAAKHLTSEYQKPSGLVVHADPARLRQILLNLVSNAIKFTPDGGTITTRCALEGRQVRIEIRDTGPGISADQIERIFQPFIQAGHGPTSSAEGTGLGLTISREYARGMGGDLLAVSEPGVGSTFILLLPHADSAAPKP